jgi:hypothetical protein
MVLCCSDFKNWYSTITYFNLIKSPLNIGKYHKLDLQHSLSLLHVLTHICKPHVTIKIVLHTQKKITRIMAAATRKASCREFSMKINIPLQVCLPVNPHSPSYRSLWATLDIPNKFKDMHWARNIDMKHMFQALTSVSISKWSYYTRIKLFNNFPQTTKNVRQNKKASS